MWCKKIGANFQRILELFTQNIANKLSKLWIWDPGSEIRDPRTGIRDPEKTYSGSRGQKGTGSYLCCWAGHESRGAEINLPPGRVSDPDPHGSALIWAAESASDTNCGSGSRRAKMTPKNRKNFRSSNPGSRSGIRIRNLDPESGSGIRIRNPDPQLEKMLAPDPYSDPH
jgi:hypothetical protein